MIKASELARLRAVDIDKWLKEVETQIVIANSMGCISCKVEWRALKSESDKKKVIKELENSGFKVTQYQGVDQREGSWDYLSVAWG